MNNKLKNERHNSIAMHISCKYKSNARDFQ